MSAEADDMGPAVLFALPEASRPFGLNQKRSMLLGNAHREASEVGIADDVLSPSGKRQFRDNIVVEAAGLAGRHWSVLP
jgi:hypothetical protein